MTTDQPPPPGGPVAIAAGSPFERLAFPFLPADDPARGIVVEAPADWSLALPEPASGLDVVVWGRLADATSSPTSAIRAAAARERAMRRLGRPPEGYRLVGVHRLPARQLGTGVRGGLRASIRAGALVELAPGGSPVVPRVLDEVLAAAGLGLGGSELAFGSGGTLLARVTGAAGGGLLRLAAAGSPGDPARLAGKLELVTGLGVPLAPRLLGHGLAAGGSWTLESVLEGRRPGSLTAGLARRAASVLATFPRAEGPPRTVATDLRGAAAALSARAGVLGRLADALATETAGLPAILRHGDLWTGNLLVDGGMLTGIVDWDAADPAGLPGADLLQLVATDLRRREHHSLGEAFLARPWDTTAFRAAAADYWPGTGIVPTPRLIELAGIAWWAAEVHGTLARLPHRAADERWLASNVDPVLATLGY